MNEYKAKASLLNDLIDTIVSLQRAVPDGKYWDTYEVGWSDAVNEVLRILRNESDWVGVKGRMADTAGVDVL